jgi:hypothetical protein
LAIFSTTLIYPAVSLMPPFGHRMHRRDEALRVATESSTLAGSFIKLRRRVSDGR